MNCSNELYCFNELDEVVQLQLEEIKSVTSFICQKHLDDKIRLFLLNQNSCSDPFNLHQQTITTNISLITENLYNQFKHTLKLIPGKKLCTRCKRTELPNWLKQHPQPSSEEFISSLENSVNTQPSISSQEKYVEKEMALDTINTILETCNLPLTNKNTSKVSIIF